MTQTKNKINWSDLAAEWFIRLLFSALGIIGLALFVTGLYGNWILAIPGGALLIISLWMLFPDKFTS